MDGAVSKTRFKMEDLANVTQMPMQTRKAHAVPLLAGVATAMHTVNVLDALTTECLVCIFSQMW